MKHLDHHCLLLDRLSDLGFLPKAELYYIQTLRLKLPLKNPVLRMN